MGARLGAAAVLALAAAAAAQPPAAAPRPYLELARSVASWLESREVRTEHGLSWPIGEPFEPGEQSANLYSGTSGIVLFLLEMHHATGEAAFLERATAGADHLIAADDRGDCGLYTGAAGIAFTLWETHRRSGELRFAQAARERLARVHAAAQAAGDGVSWTPVTDVIGGSAGIGAFLLWAARAMDDPPSLALAQRAGRWLIAQAQREGEGRRWPMAKDSEREYPNFSHGTAGVAWFLAELYRAKGEKAFLDAAIDGARYLEATAVDGLVLHHRPGGEELYYLGWCHGPPGTTRLYEALGEITGEARWRQHVDAALEALVASGIPESRPAGFWNNAGQCCGTAGVIEWLLEVGTEPAHQALLGRLVEDLRARATTDENGTRWVVAEHRVRPELLGAQTGYMQGAAGIGMCLLHLDGAQCGRDPAIALPDAPTALGSGRASAPRRR
jgi:lantibiotic modifying enzyme